MRFLFTHRLSVMLLPGLLLLAGCNRTHSNADFLPSEAKARQALETALGAWQSGQKFGRIDSVSPAIEVLDSKWQAGQKLEKYEIVAAEPVDGKPTRFLVRLTMKAPAAKPQDVRYVVLGIDPLWVQREEDHKRVSGM